MSNSYVPPPQVKAKLFYRDDPDISLNVTLVNAWKRGDIPCSIESASSGDKEYIKNMVYRMFEADTAAEAIAMVIGKGPFFFLIRRGKTYYDVAGKAVEVKLK